MRILFVNLPYMGHVIPTVGLVRELTRAGHRVTCLLPRDWEAVTAPGNPGAVQILEEYMER